jgi:GNAT superfamily N-acetyltransferase
MELEIREMKETEAHEALALSRKAFGLLEGIFIPKPKTGIVAVVDDRIVGGVFYKAATYGKTKLGTIDFIFVDPSTHGKGVGKLLYEYAITFLRAQGCDALAAIVRDDNIASWGIFVNGGFVRAGLPKLTKLLGVSGIAKLFLTTYGVSIGYECYIALPEKEETLIYEKSTNSAVQIIAYIAVNLFIAAFLLFVVEHGLSLLAASLLVFSGCVFAGYIGTLLTKRKWRFRLVAGGAGICLLGITTMLVFKVFCFIPLVGNWYPHKYENSKHFRKDMAINAIFVWVYLLILSAITIITSNSMSFLTYVSYIASILLILRCIPFDPATSYGGGRVFQWNKFVYGVLAAASVSVITLAHISING